MSRKAFREIVLILKWYYAKDVLIFGFVSIIRYFFVNGNPVSIALLPVDCVLKRKAFGIVFEVFDEHVDVLIKRMIKRKIACNVRRDQKVLRLPKRAVLRERLGMTSRAAPARWPVSRKTASAVSSMAEPLPTLTT